MDIDNLLNKIRQIEHGFHHIHKGADEILSAYPKEQCFELALELFRHEAYQFRMLATTLLGRLATENNNALCFLKETVGTDKNWRVQEMLAMAFDEVCKCGGYEVSLPLIEEWLNDDYPCRNRRVEDLDKPSVLQRESVNCHCVNRQAQGAREQVSEEIRG